MGLQMFAWVICIEPHLILRSKCIRVELRAIIVTVNENALQASVCPGQMESF